MRDRQDFLEKREGCDPGCPGRRGPPASSAPSVQEACLQGNLIAICLEQLSDPHPLLRQWVAICLGRIWQNFDSARWCGVRDSAHEKLCSLLSDPIPEVGPSRLVVRPRPRGRQVLVVLLTRVGRDAVGTGPPAGACSCQGASWRPGTAPHGPSFPHWHSPSS